MNAPILHLLDATTTPDGLEMLATLIAADPPGAHRVVVMGHTATIPRAVAAGVPMDCLEHVHSIGAFDPTGWRDLSQMARRDQPSHLHAWGFQAMVAATVLRTPRSRRIATFTVMPEIREQKWLRRMARYAPWLWLATSEYLARALAQLVPGGTPPHGPRGVRIAHVAPGIRTSDSRAQNSDRLRKVLGIRPDDGPVLMLGGEISEPAARQTYGLWAAAIIAQIFPRTRLLLHTGLPQPLTWPQEMLSVRQLAATAPDSDFIIYAAPEMRWRDLLPLADVLMLTPHGTISIHCALRAMAAGIPIVATPTPQMQALIDHGRTGLLAEVDKPRSIAARLEELLSDPALARRLAVAAREHVENNFRPDRMVEQLRAVYAPVGELSPGWRGNAALRGETQNARCTT